MSESSDLSQPSSLRYAAILGAVVLLILVALVPLLAYDKGARTTLETTAETTAVGDEALLHHRSRGPAPVLSLHGRPLVPPSPRHLELHDTKMTFAGMEDGGTLRLYTTTEDAPWVKGEVQQKDQPVYYLKIDANEYLRVQ
ncbi:MAG TPA: hypothetical protein VGO11_27750 [Chthoniobacteraceae bacterium]|jgi:hypothetical protein|nr:hypothetical protein [Chthoniobacteraceae bacterium]